MRWILFSLVVLIGCEGERVTAAREDAGADSTGLDSVAVDSANDSATDAANDGAVGECGAYRGATMVRVGSYCIDTTEVTRGQFLEFLAAPVKDRVAARPPECAWNADSPPINASAEGLGIAVGDTNFCDAATYCAWANKRLCGRIGGGANEIGDFANKDKSEWFAVCSPTGNTYVYGDAYSATRCFTEGGLSEATGSRINCAGTETPYSQVFDLNGNVFEWENSCEASPASKTTRCRARGGGSGSGDKATCAMPDLTTVDTRLPGFGFRCCKD